LVLNRVTEIYRSLPIAADMCEDTLISLAKPHIQVLTAPLYPECGYLAGLRQHALWKSVAMARRYMAEASPMIAIY
jgi:hypothetical protein